MESLVITTYNINIPKESFQSNIDRLTNQIWKLIPMRENNENWQEHLQSVVVEVAGLTNILGDKTDFLILLSKLTGLLKTETTFEIYRKTVFESISLLRGMA